MRVVFPISIVPNVAWSKTTGVEAESVVERSAAVDAFEVEIRRLQGQLDNLMQLARRNGDGEAPLIEWPPPNGDPPPPRTHNPNIRTAGTEATQGIQ
jgi:hypothetical protein